MAASSKIQKQKKKLERHVRDPKYYPITGKGCVQPKLEALTDKVRTMRAEILGATFQQAGKMSHVDNEFRLEAARLQVEINDLVNQAVMILSDVDTKLRLFEDITSEDEDVARDDEDEDC